MGYTEKKAEFMIKDELLRNCEVNELVEFWECTDRIFGRMYHAKLIMNDGTKIILHNLRKKDECLYGRLVRIGEFTDLYLLYDEKYGFNLSANAGAELKQKVLSGDTICCLLDNYKELLDYFRKLPLVDRKVYELIQCKKYAEVYDALKEGEFISGGIGMIVVLKADDFSWSQWN